MIRLFVCLIGFASAAEPVATLEEQETHRASLEAERDALVEKQSLSRCEAARDSYRGAEAELALINAELAVPVSSALGELQTAYRAKLEALKRSEEVKLAKAKTEANAAGAVYVAIDAKIAAIDAELARLQPAKSDRVVMQKQQLDKEIAENAGVLEALRDSSEFDRGLRYTHPIGYEARPAPPPKPAPLPAVFAGCFPNEVAS